MHGKQHIFKLVMLLGFAINACNNHQDKIATNDSAVISIDTAHRPTVNTILSNKDTLVVNRKAAIFYEPDSAQIEQRKKAVGENDFYAGVEDYAYYLNAAHDFLDSAKLLSLDAKNKKVIAFISYQTEQFIRLDTLQELWGIYFFEPAKTPKLIDMTDIEEAYKAYYK